MPIIEYENLGKVNEPFFNEYRAAFEDVLQSGWYILGDSVKKFEQQYAAYCNSPHCVGVANGLDALALSLKAAGIAPGSEVLVPSNTYIATILAILHNGLKPVLVEPDLATYNIDPARVEERITPNTKAIVVVHLYGKLCDMEAIMAIADRHHLFVLEDCAQAHGAAFKGRKAGSWGHASAHSFYPTKNLGALADAGAITCREEAIKEKLRALRNYGSREKYHNELAGYNSRLGEMQAAFLSIKLQHLDAINTHKRKLAALYLEGLKDDFIKPVVYPGYHDVYHIFNVRHPERNRLKAWLLQQGIQTEIHYPVSPIEQKAMKGLLGSEPTPIAAEIHQTTLSLPVSYFHTEADVCRVLETMNKF
ncbi:MAG TPA: DegT/DnrJ/EryC1/StrS family aminotransferase [Chitinophagaceae bacterium]